MIAKACVMIHTKPESKFLGTVFEIPCHRHADAFYIVSQFMEPEDIDRRKTQQGFLTHEEKFLDRYDAMDHAIACNQLPPEAKEACAELYSEDLW